MKIGSLQSYWAKQGKPSTSTSYTTTTLTTSSSVTTTSTIMPSTSSSANLTLTTAGKSNQLQNMAVDLTEESMNTSNSESDNKINSQLKTNRIASVQIQLQNEIDVLNSELVGLYERKKRGLITDEDENKLNNKKKLKIELEKKLKTKKGDQERSQKARDEKKKQLNILFEKNFGIHYMCEKKQADLE